MTERGGTRGIVLAVVGVLALVAVAVAAVVVTRDDGGGGSPTTTLSPDAAGARAAAEAFAAAVGEGRPGEGGTTAPVAEVDVEYLTAVEGLAGVDLDATVGEVVVDGDAATAALETTWALGAASWTTSGRLDLVRSPPGDEGTWRAEWDLGALDDRLRAGDRLSAESGDAPRGRILAAGGEVLAGGSGVVVVGVQPQRATDVEALVAELVRLLGVDGAELTARIAAAEPTAFVEVATLTEADYAPLRDELRPLPGTVFRREGQDAGAGSELAAPVLGQVLPATEEQVEASDGRLRPGQPTGSGGIQQAFDETLAGTPGLVVSVTRATAADGAAGGDDGTTTTTGASDGAPEVEVLEEVAPVPGEDVVTTLEVRVQEAAEAALFGQTRIASLVALRPSTGEVLADANINAGGFDYGSRAQVPPGSTFKVVSTLAHLRKGLTPDQIVPCPETASVDGREFGNAGGFSLGDVPFSRDFARSCNTAFVTLAADLAPTDLTDAAAAFGLGVEWTTGITTQTGSVPPTEGPVDTAAASIGQGRIVTSPLAMAGVAATVAAGRWRAPVLVTDPPVEIPEERPLAPGEAETLAALMREVVADGTGEALRDVPGSPVMAKTGTAEFGNEDPPETHAWIIGSQDDVAFAVFVEGGEAGGTVAGPVAARFLTTLAGG